jgi:Asp-tRNA(Asn)/Glu-tRNA(Gln) amidotransferase A subunit family amidase
MAAIQRTPKGMTIGVPRKFHVYGLESDVATLLDEAPATFGGSAHDVVEADLPDQTAISAAALIVLAVKARACLVVDYGARCATDCRTGLPTARSNTLRQMTSPR